MEYANFQVFEVFFTMKDGTFLGRYKISSNFHINFNGEKVNPWKINIVGMTHDIDLFEMLMSTSFNIYICEEYKKVEDGKKKAFWYKFDNAEVICFGAGDNCSGDPHPFIYSFEAKERKLISKADLPAGIKNELK